MNNVAKIVTGDAKANSDKARLDWLSRRTDFEFIAGADTLSDLYVGHDSGESHPLRELIDEAMAEDEQE